SFHPDSESHRDLFVILDNEDSFQARPPFSALLRMRESARRTPGRPGEGVSDKADECVGVVWLEQQADSAAFDGLSTQLRVLTGSGDNNRDGASFGHSAQVFGQIETVARGQRYVQDDQVWFAARCLAQARNSIGSDPRGIAIGLEAHALRQSSFFVIFDDKYFLHNHAA